MQAHGVFLCATAAETDDTIDFQLLEILFDDAGHVFCFSVNDHAMWLVAAGAENCSAKRENAGECGAIEFDVAVLDEAEKSIAKADDFHSVIALRGFADTADCSVESGAIAAGGQDSDALRFIGHATILVGEGKWCAYIKGLRWREEDRIGNLVRRDSGGFRAALTGCRLRLITLRYYREFLMSSFEKSGWMRAASCAVAAVLLLGAQILSGQTDAETRFEALLKQGFQLHQESKFEEAIPLLESARKLEPQDYFANLLLGIDLLRVGKTAEAVPRLELAARVKPGEAIADGYLGEAEADLGNHARAAAAYEEAVRRGTKSEKKFDEDAVEAWAGFALERFRALNEELRSSDAGMRKARELEANQTKPVAELKCAGSIEGMEGGLALKGAQSQSARVEAVYQLAVCYAVEAGKAADALKSGGEDAAALHQLRGDVLLRLSEDPAGAEKEFAEAIRLRPQDPALLERLAEAQFSAGEEDAAKESAQAALKIDPHRRGALRTLASLEMNARDYEAAVPVLRELVKEEPGSRMLKVQLGKALAQLDQADEAYGLLAPALAAGYPDEKGALHALLSRECRKMGRTVEADRAEAEAKRLSDKFQSEGAHESQ